MITEMGYTLSEADRNNLYGSTKMPKPTVAKELLVKDATETVAAGTEQLIKAAEHYEELARSLRSTVTQLDRIHQ